MLQILVKTSLQSEKTYFEQIPLSDILYICAMGYIFMPEVKYSDSDNWYCSIWYLNFEKE